MLLYSVHRIFARVFDLGKLLIEMYGLVKSRKITFIRENAEKSVKRKRNMTDFIVHTDYVSMYVCSIEVTPWSRFLVKKRIAVQLGKEFTDFMELWVGLLPCS
jgi:hypothetical protein